MAILQNAWKWIETILQALLTVIRSIIENLSLGRQAKRNA